MTAEPTETHINTILIGGSLESREMLTHALLEVCGSKPEAIRRSDVPEEQDFGRIVEYASGHRRYAQIIPPAELRAESFLDQAGMVDGAIVLADAPAQWSPTVRRQLLLAAASGVKQFVLLVQFTSTSAPADVESRERAELLSLLAQSGQTGQDVHTVGVADDSTQTARRLLAAANARFTTRKRDPSPPFMMTVEDVFSIKGRGVVVTGTVDRGVVSVGDQIELTASGRRKVTTCRGIEIFRGTLNTARPGDNVGILLASVEKDEVQRGAVLGTPGQLHVKQECQALVSLLPSGHDSATVDTRSPWQGQVLIGKTPVNAVVAFAPDLPHSQEGSGRAVVVKTTEALIMKEGLPLVMLQDGQVIGVGRVGK